jgi:hypothetical protein
MKMRTVYVYYMFYKILFPKIVAKNVSTEGLPEKPVYANIAKQIQAKKAALLDEENSQRTNSSRPMEFDVHKLRKTKPEKTFKLKIVKNPNEGKIAV